MPELQERETKLVQYLTEAYGKEKELETALEAHISMTARAPYKKRLQQHLRETKSHSREVERRIKKLGGEASNLQEVATAASSVVSKAMSAAKGPLHMIRGTGENEKMLKNAKTEYADEHEEIAQYSAIETLAVTVGDKDTAKLARTIRRDEERMAGFLERQITQLTKAVATEEIPASQRRTGGRRRRASSRSKASARSSAAGAKSSSAKSGGSRAKTGSGSRAKAGSGSRAKSSSGSRAKSGGSRRAASSRSR